MRDLTNYNLDNRFILKTMIGRGGTSTIWLAQDITGKLSKYWAVKYVETQEYPGLLEKYRAEVRVLDNLSHPNMTNIHYYSEKEDSFFLVINYINGDTLFQTVKNNGVQSEKNVVAWAKMLCDVLHYLHTVRKNPIIYCDLNPKNIMLDDHNIPYLIDFGLATEIHHGEYIQGPPLGTKGYAAPEQYKKGKRLLDERTDVYGLGATLYHLITGEKPERNVTIEPIELNSNVSVGLNHLIMKCLEQDPQHRYQNMLEVKRELNELYKYNQSYKNNLKRKLIIFSISAVVMLSSLAITGFGYAGIISGSKENYNNHYNSAQQYVLKAEYDKAEEEYISAISVNQNAPEAYQGLYQLLSNENSGYTNKAMVQNRVDVFKLNTIPKALRVVPDIMLNLSLDALDLNQITYSEYADDLLKELKTTKEYKANELDQKEIDALEKIAENGKELESDPQKVKDAVEQLNYSSQETSNDTTKAINNYVIIMLYGAYPDILTDKSKVNKIIEETDAILERNNNNKDFKFTKKIPLCIMVASQYYLQGSIEKDASKQMELYNKANNWMSKTGEVPLDVSDYVLKGNILKGLKNYSEAKKAYQSALTQNPQNIDLLISLCQLCIEEQNATGKKDYSEAKVYFNQIKQMDTSNLPVVTLQQINSLKTQIE